jgi:hypothetical protein
MSEGEHHGVGADHFDQQPYAWVVIYTRVEEHVVEQSFKRRPLRISSDAPLAMPR